MRFIFLLFVVVTNFSCTSFFRRDPANTAVVNFKPRHVIVTVHGLTGNALTWGSFDTITTDYLNQINSDYEVSVSNFVYPTGRSEKMGTVDFADQLNAHIESLFKEQPLQEKDRISIVAHSQGGLVSYIWYFSRVLDPKLDQKYISHVDTIITLGTPFWGSKFASMLTDKGIPNLVPLINLFADSPITRRELLDMSFGSDVVHNFRQLAIKMDSDPVVKARLNSLPIRLINIMGILPQKKEDLYVSQDGNLVSKFAKKVLNEVYKLFKNPANGPDRVESDIAVMVPSGRWNFIYTKPQIIKTGLNKIGADKFNQFENFVDRDRSKFLFTESSHLPFDNDNTLSMAYINKSCAVVENCNHPTYRYVLEQLANCEKTRCDRNKFDNIVTRMKTMTRSYYDAATKTTAVVNDHEAYKDISKYLQTFSIQLEMKLKPGMIARFPVKYFVGHSNGEDQTIWELREPTLIGEVIDLKRTKDQKSIATTPDLDVYISPKSERRSIDIVSRESNIVTGHDILRVNLIGYVRNPHNKEKIETDKFLVVPLSINLPGLPKVDIEAGVHPGYSTYIPLDYTNVSTP